jgi:hypothetical protein
MNDQYPHVSFDDKIKQLNLREYQHKFTKEQIDIYYNVHMLTEIKKHNTNIILNIINKDILEVLNNDTIADIRQFKITRDELAKIDGAKVVNDNWDDLKKIGMKKKDLHFSRKNQIKMFSLTIIKGLLKYIGMKLTYCQQIKTNKITKIKEQTYYYKVTES